MPPNLDFNKINGTDNNPNRPTLMDRLRDRLLAFGQSWVTRQAVKLGYVASAAITALLIRHGTSQDSATQLGEQIAGVIGTASLIGFEFLSSWLAHKERPIPKALPVEQ